MLTSRILLAGLLLALTACGGAGLAREQTTGWSKHLPYTTASRAHSPAETCYEVDAYTGACVAY